MTEPRIVATIPKNSREDVRVALTTYQGHDLIDIRVYAAADPIRPRSNRSATKSGVSINRAKIPELIRALQAAEREGKA